MQRATTMHAKPLTRIRVQVGLSTNPLIDKNNAKSAGLTCGLPINLAYK